MAGHETDSPIISEGGGDSKNGSSRFLIEPSSPVAERNAILGSTTLPTGCPPISFRPPVHRKHDRSHHGKSKGSHKRPPRTAYSDVPLRLLGSQSSIDSPEYHISPTHSLPVAMQRKSDSAIEQEIEQIPEFNRSYSCGNKSTAIDNVIVVNGLNEKPPNTVTMTGTIKRGKKQDMVNVNLSKDELDALNRSTLMDKDKSTGAKCGLRMGPHILLLSILYTPIAFITSLVVSFYTGSMCWYNIYIYFSEEKTLAHKLLICPLLILLYPFLIVLFSLVIAIYASIVQISWYFSSWFKEIKDFDKNVFGCICDKIGLPQCSPYDVIIIDDNVEKSETNRGSENIENEVEMCMLSNQEDTTNVENPEVIVMGDVETYCMDEESQKLQQQESQITELQDNTKENAQEDSGEKLQVIEETGRDFVDSVNNTAINTISEVDLNTEQEISLRKSLDANPEPNILGDTPDKQDKESSVTKQEVKMCIPEVKSFDDNVEFEYEIDSNVFEEEIINDIMMNAIEEVDEEEEDDDGRFYTAHRSFSSGEEREGDCEESTMDTNEEKHKLNHEIDKDKNSL